MGKRDREDAGWDAGEKEGGLEDGGSDRAVQRRRAFALGLLSDEAGFQREQDREAAGVHQQPVVAR